MHPVQLSVRSRAWGSLVLASALAAGGLAWVAATGGGQGAALTGGHRLEGGQAPSLMQPFTPQHLTGGLASGLGDRAARR
jgi:hypothetical protein